MDLKFKDNSKLKLDIIKQLEYIQTSSGFRIDTLINPQNAPVVVLDGSIDDDTDNWLVNNSIGNAYTTQSGKFGYNFNRKQLIQYHYGGSRTACSTSSFSGRHVFEFGKEFKVDNNVILTSQNNYIFDTNQSAIALRELKITIYSCKIYDGDILVRDYVPSIDENNISCLYDLISNQYFYNIGSGVFAAGQFLKYVNFPENLILKTTTLYHKNTPNTDGLRLLHDIFNAQETAENIVLDRIRVDIGNVSGSLSELMQYSSMAGFNDAGEEQAKPRLVGTWELNDWHISDQIAYANNIFDGLNVVSDNTHLINFDDLAVQVIDSSEGNYNPAVSIILQSKGLGVTTDSPVVDGQTGRWFLTKEQASSITNIGNWFKQVSSVVDSSAIVSSDATTSYDLEEFDEFQYFTGITSLVSSGDANAYKGAMTMPKLKSIKLPSTLTTLQQSAWGESATFGGCSMLEEIDLSHITSYGKAVCANCTSLRKVILPETATVISPQMFQFCSNLEEIVGIDNITIIQSSAFGSWSSPWSRYPGELPANIERLEGGTYSGAFHYCRFTFRNIPASCTYLGTHLFMETGTPYLHLLGENPPQIDSNFFYNQNDVGTFYVGNYYKEKSKYVYEKYYDSSYWIRFRSKLKDWYYFAAPQISYDGTNVTMTVMRTSNIYYTTDGTVPTTSSTGYSAAFAWNGTGVIKAMAIDSNGDIAYADDFYATTAQNPVISNTSSQITISAESGATIYYTLDGTHPTLDSSVYSGPISITQDMGDFVKVRCFAKANNKNNSVDIGKIIVLDDNLWGTDGETSTFAVQCIDSTKPNYNPAVCIILDNNNKLTDKCYGGGGGYLAKTDASLMSITTTMTQNVTTVTDTSNLIDSSIHDFDDMSSLKWFSNTSLGNSMFSGCKKLKYVTLDKITSIGAQTFNNCQELLLTELPETLTSLGDRVFQNCYKITVSKMPSSFTRIDTWFLNCRGIVSFDFTGILSVGYQAFNGCTSLKQVILDDQFTNLGTGSFGNCGAIEFFKIPPLVTNIPDGTIHMKVGGVVHCLPETPPTIAEFNTIRPNNNVFVYVGDNSSEEHDNDVLAAYLANSNWNTYYGSRLDTWYNYLHPSA